MREERRRRDSPGHQGRQNEKRPLRSLWLEVVRANELSQPCALGQARGTLSTAVNRCEKQKQREDSYS